MLAKCVRLPRPAARMLSLYFQGALLQPVPAQFHRRRLYKAYKLGGSLGERGLALATVAAIARRALAIIVLASRRTLLTSGGWPLAVYPLLVAVVGLAAFGVAAAVSRFTPGWLTKASRIPKLGPAIEKLRPWAESPIAQRPTARPAGWSCNRSTSRPSAASASRWASTCPRWRM